VAFTWATIGLNSFYSRDAMLARVLAVSLWPCVCLSVCVGVLSKRMNESGWFFGAGASFDLSYTLYCKETQVTSKIRVLPSGTLLQTRDLKIFATANGSPKRVINLARERWTLRAERDKLGRRRSTELIIPSSSDARRLVYRADRQALSTARFFSCRVTDAWLSNDVVKSPSVCLYF